MNHIRVILKLNTCVSGSNSHQSSIQSMNDLLVSRILKPSWESNYIDCENSQLKNRWSIVFVSFSQNGHNGFMVLMNLNRLPLTVIALYRHLHMNITVHGGMFFRYHNALKIFLRIDFILKEDEIFFFMYCLYANLVEKLPEVVRVQIGLSLSCLSTSLR